MCFGISAFNDKQQVGLYYSDVSGAFDRACAERLLTLSQAWLRRRLAYVIVYGEKSSVITLENMIFQGSILGLVLWNLFYAGCKRPVEKKAFTESVFADDLNCFRKYHKSIGQTYILKELSGCQRELHQWGSANTVTFDPLKEHFLILDSMHPHADNFELLGVLFDTKLSMFNEVTKVSNEASRRLHVLLRLRRYYKASAMFHLYKAHMLPYLERSTPAISHAYPNVLVMLDNVQTNFQKMLTHQRKMLSSFLIWHPSRQGAMLICWF